MECTAKHCKECGSIMSPIMGDDMEQDKCIDCTLGLNE